MAEQSISYTTHLLDSGCSKAGASAFASGQSVLEVPNLLDAAECGVLRNAATQTVLRRTSKLGVLLRSQADLVPHGKTRVPVDTLDENHIVCVDALLAKVIDFLETVVPHEAEAIFGRRKGLSKMAIRFQVGEPSINIYTHGGEFVPHTDDFHLTVLVPLSPPSGTFTGGGTAFWSKHALRRCGNSGCPGGITCAIARHVRPTLLAKPRAGTGLLWTGSMPHAGLPVHGGIRHVLVCSFSLRDRKRETDLTLNDGIAAHDALGLFFDMS